MDYTAATLPSDTSANEDWAAATSDVIVVLDGATVRTDTGCSHGPAWYSRKLGAAIISGAESRTRALPDVLAGAIAAVADLHRDSCDLEHPGTPSAALAVVRVEGDVVRYVVLGDVTVVADVDGKIEAISDPRISSTAAAERQRANQHLIGTQEKADAMVAMKHAELAARNQPNGYWIAAADPAAAQHAVTGSWPTVDVRDVAVLTDGAARFVDTFKRASWSGLLAVLRANGPGNVIDLVREIERHDEQGARYPRNKTSDDATVVYAVPNRPLPEMQPPLATAEERAQRALENPVVYAARYGNLMGDQSRNPNWTRS